MVFTHARIRIGAVVIFAVGLTINLIAILMPRGSLYPIAMIIAGVGAVGLYGSRWLSTKTQSHASGNSTQTAASPKSLHHNDSPPVTNNRDWCLHDRQAVASDRLVLVRRDRRYCRRGNIYGESVRTAEPRRWRHCDPLWIGIVDGYLLRVPEATVTNSVRRGVRRPSSGAESRPSTRPSRGNAITNMGSTIGTHGAIMAP